MSDTLNSIVLDKTCFCNISSFILNLPVYAIKKRKDSVILKEEPFDFMGEWRLKKNTKNFEIQDPILPEKSNEERGHGYGNL